MPAGPEPSQILTRSEKRWGEHGQALVTHSLGARKRGRGQLGQDLPPGMRASFYWPWVFYWKSKGDVQQIGRTPVRGKYKSSMTHAGCIEMWHGSQSWNQTPGAGFSWSSRVQGASKLKRGTGDPCPGNWSQPVDMGTKEKVHFAHQVRKRKPAGQTRAPRLRVGPSQESWSPITGKLWNGTGCRGRRSPVKSIIELEQHHQLLISDNTLLPSFLITITPRHSRWEKETNSDHARRWNVIKGQSSHTGLIYICVIVK